MYLYHFNSSVIIFFVLVNTGSKGDHWGLPSNTCCPSSSSGIFFQKKWMRVSVGIQEAIRPYFSLLISIIENQNIWIIAQVYQLNAYKNNISKFKMVLYTTFWWRSTQKSTGWFKLGELYGNRSFKEWRYIEKVLFDMNLKNVFKGAIYNKNKNTRMN